MTNVRVTFEGAERLQQRLKDPRVIRGPLLELLGEATQIAEDAARAAIKGGTEYAMQSINSMVQPLALYGKVSTMMPKVRALSIEQGRPPGQAPTLLAIARWITGRRYLSGYRLETLTKNERAAVVKAQKAIDERGARAKRFIGTARDKVKAEMPRLVAEMAADVEEMFRRS